MLQDVMTLHGAQFKDADAIVASPPCQRYSYMAMPWDLSKREIRWQEWERDSPFGNFRLNDLFDACFRIQREASEAKGKVVPLVVENVKGAQPWVGLARWHFGSFYLYGDVPALMPMMSGKVKIGGRVGDDWFVHHNRQEFFDRAAGSDGMKGGGGAWFNDYKTRKLRGGTIARLSCNSSHSAARKAASAAIAEIPFELSSHIARMLKP